MRYLICHDHLLILLGNKVQDFVAGLQPKFTLPFGLLELLMTGHFYQAFCWVNYPVGLLKIKLFFVSMETAIALVWSYLLKAFVGSCYGWRGTAFNFRRFALSGFLFVFFFKGLYYNNLGLWFLVLMEKVHFEVVLVVGLVFAVVLEATTK